MFSICDICEMISETWTRQSVGLQSICFKNVGSKCTHCEEIIPLKTKFSTTPIKVTWDANRLTDGATDHHRPRAREWWTATFTVRNSIHN